MKRRRLLLGIGGSVGLGSGIIGSGAFSTVSADRSLTIDTEIDEDAYLSLDAWKGEYSDIKIPEGTVTFEFTELSAPGTTGQGLGPDSVYTFTDVLRVQNFGNKTVRVFGEYTDNAVYDIKLLQTTDVDSAQGGKDDPLTELAPSAPLPPGASVGIGFLIDTHGISVGDYDTSISIVAAADDAQQ